VISVRLAIWAVSLLAQGWLVRVLVHLGQNGVVCPAGADAPAGRDALSEDEFSWAICRFAPVPGTPAREGPYPHPGR
jgi:hypothetical protein